MFAGGLVGIIAMLIGLVCFVLWIIVLIKQFQDAGVPVEFHAFEGVPHAFDSNPEFAVLSAQLADFFIDRHILSPRTYPPFGGGGRGQRTGR